jgi:hypothetical protein
MLTIDSICIYIGNNSTDTICLYIASLPKAKRTLLSDSNVGQYISFECSEGTGEDYVKKNFPGIEYEVFNLDT